MVSSRTVEIYEELANHEDHRGAPQMRDRYLVLAADAALLAGSTAEAERLRVRLLQHNPHHMLKPYSCLEEALRSPDVHSYLINLRRVCTPETAERLLHSLHKTTPPPEKGNHAAPAPARPPENPSSPPRPAKSERPVDVLPPLFGPQPEAWRPREEPQPGEEPDVGGVWIPMALFGLLLAVAVALVGYILARPFWS